MVQVDPIDRIMRAALVSDGEFVTALNDLLRHDLRISVRELSEKSGIAQSSLYKILHGRRSPNLSTLRAIIRALRQLYHVGDEDFIGLIAARPVLESVEERMADVEQLVHVPVATIIPRESVQQAIELAARKAWL